MHVGVSCGPRPLSTSHRHWRHMPTELIRLCQQKRGMYVPARSAAAMTSSPLRAVNGVPLIVIATASGSGSGVVTSSAESATVSPTGSVVCASLASSGAATSPGLGWSPVVGVGSASAISGRLRPRRAQGPGCR